MEYAALYIRVSTDEQTELSPAAQERALKEWAARNGYKILPEHIYIDEGISGKKAIKRPAFMTMIGTAKRKPSPFQAILVHKFDRFARSREDSVVYKSLLRKECGVKVISITEQIEDDKFSVILEAMLEAMAEYYSLNLADEVKKGMTEKARRGGYQTHAPFGYEYREAKKPICIKEDEAAAVKMIFEMYVNDHIPTYLIAKKLNEMGLKTKTGGKFEKRAVLYILNNPIYAGTVRWCSDGPVNHGSVRATRKADAIICAKGKHEPIISQELFQAAQARLELDAAAAPNKRSQPTNLYRHWLSGLLFCDTCGTGMICDAQRTHPGFQCRAYTRGKCTVSHYISLTKMESLVIDALKEATGASDLSVERIQPMKDTSQIDILEAQLAKIPDKLSRAKDAYLAGVDTVEEYKTNKDHLLLEEARIKKQLRELRQKSQKEVDLNQYRQKINNTIAILESDASIEKKMEAIRSIVHRIIFRKADKSIEVYYYEG